MRRYLRAVICSKQLSDLMKPADRRRAIHKGYRAAQTGCASSAHSWKISGNEFLVWFSGGGAFRAANTVVCISVTALSRVRQCKGWARKTSAVT